VSRRPRGPVVVAERIEAGPGTLGAHETVRRELLAEALARALFAELKAGTAATVTTQAGSNRGGEGK
jgi:hypothetical protein